MTHCALCVFVCLWITLWVCVCGCSFSLYSEWVSLFYHDNNDRMKHAHSSRLSINESPTCFLFRQIRQRNRQTHSRIRRLCRYTVREREIKRDDIGRQLIQWEGHTHMLLDSLYLSFSLTRLMKKKDSLEIHRRKLTIGASTCTRIDFHARLS